MLRSVDRPELQECQPTADQSARHACRWLTGRRRRYRGRAFATVAAGVQSRVMKWRHCHERYRSGYGCCAGTVAPRALGMLEVSSLGSLERAERAAAPAPRPQAAPGRARGGAAQPAGWLLRSLLAGCCAHLAASLAVTPAKYLPCGWSGGHRKRQHSQELGAAGIRTPLSRALLAVPEGWPSCIRTPSAHSRVPTHLVLRNVQLQLAGLAAAVDARQCAGAVRAGAAHLRGRAAEERGAGASREAGVGGCA